MKGYYCKIDAQNTEGKRDFLHVFAHEFCLEGSYYRAGDAVNYSIGQGDTLVTPLQLARAYAALSNGGTLYEPRIGKAIVSPDGTVLKRIAPKVQGHVEASAASMRYVDQALLGTAKVGTMAWKMIDFPLDQVHIRSQDGLGRGLRQAVDVVGGVLRRELRRRDDGQPGRHRLGHLGPGGPGDLGGALRHQRHDRRPEARGDPRDHSARGPADVPG